MQTYIRIFYTSFNYKYFAAEVKLHDYLNHCLAVHTNLPAIPLLWGKFGLLVMCLVPCKDVNSIISVLVELWTIVSMEDLWYAKTGEYCLKG